MTIKKKKEKKSKKKTHLLSCGKHFNAYKKQICFCEYLKLLAFKVFIFINKL